MTTTQTDGGPAFPAREYESRPFSMGMTLRDYFAAKALQGLLSELAHPDSDPRGAVNWSIMATQAYIAADAMLAARERTAQ